MRVTYPLATAALALSLAAPTAHADRPAKGTFFNGSVTKGGYLITSKTSIKELSLYCGGARYAVRELVRIKPDGSFRLNDGSAERYGAGGAPRGLRDVSLSGRFTSNTSVRIKGTLEQCGTRTFVLTRES
jgi:hypothetical protein